MANIECTSLSPRLSPTSTPQENPNTAAQALKQIHAPHHTGCRPQPTSNISSWASWCSEHTPQSSLFPPCTPLLSFQASSHTATVAKQCRPSPPAVGAIARAVSAPATTTTTELSKTRPVPGWWQSMRQPRRSGRRKSVDSYTVSKDQIFIPSDGPPSCVPLSFRWSTQSSVAVPSLLPTPSKKPAL